MFSQRFNKYSLLAVCALLFSPFTGVHAQSFAEVAVGKFHVCGLTDAGEVNCVTDAITKRYDAPTDLPFMKALAAGQQHTCGLTLDGKAICWGGIDFYQEQQVPDIDQPLVSIAAGVNHTCAIDETNRAWCWGLDTNQQSVRDTLLKKITLTTVSNLMLVSWEGPMTAGVNGLKAYEIRVNNETVALTDGNIFLYPNFVRRDCYVFNVVALSDDNSILDNRSVVYAPYQVNTFNCGRG